MVAGCQVGAVAGVAVQGDQLLQDGGAGGAAERLAGRDLQRGDLAGAVAEHGLLGGQPHRGVGRQHRALVAVGAVGLDCARVIAGVLLGAGQQKQRPPPPVVAGRAGDDGAEQRGRSAVVGEVGGLGAAVLGDALQVGGERLGQQRLGGGQHRAVLAGRALIKRQRQQLGAGDRGAGGGRRGRQRVGRRGQRVRHRGRRCRQGQRRALQGGRRGGRRRSLGGLGAAPRQADHQADHPQTSQIFVLFTTGRQLRPHPSMLPSGRPKRK